MRRLGVSRANTILYCRRWGPTVAFYREMLGLEVSFEKDWFVEFAVDDAFLSIADASRATEGSVEGHGVTLSWQVSDVEAIRRWLGGRGVEISAVSDRWGARVVDVRDPEGNRLELWEPWAQGR